MNKLLNKVCYALYVLIYLFCATLMSTNRLKGGLWSTGGSSPFIYFKLIFAFILMFIVTNAFINHIEFISKAVVICNIVLAVLFTVDYCTRKASGTMILYSLWWLGAILASSLGVFTSATLKLPKEKYKSFFDRFVIGIIPVYIVLLCIAFLRKPGRGFSYNYILFKGNISMLKSFIRNPVGDFEAPLIFFGNILVFMPVAFILKALFPKIKSKTMIIVGILCPIIAEGYQLIFRCGNVDIDDIVTNFLGFLFGYGLYKLIEKKKLTA